MIKHRCQVRVRYAETDRMGYVYYGNYATFYEVARVELLRHLGMSYRELEEQGMMLPVREMHCKYLKPATYDELLTIEAIVPQMPDVKIRFDYRVLNAQEELLNEGTTTLVFVDKEQQKVVRIPPFAEKLFTSHFH